MTTTVVAEGIGYWLEKASRESLKGQIDLPFTREDLAIYFAAVAFTKGAEIGVERGHFSKVLLEWNPGLHLLCVDAWQAYPNYREHVSQSKIDGFYEETAERLALYNATLIRKFSVDAAAYVEDGSLDFAYLDANHTYDQVSADIAAWAPKVRAGGILSGHDFCRRKRMDFGVIEAVREWGEKNDTAPLFILRGDRSPSWFYVKR